MLLYDRIRNREVDVFHLGDGQVDSAHFAKELEWLLGKAVPFDFTNIEEMYLADVKAKGNRWAFPRDAFSAIPPYPITWCEVRSRMGFDVGAIFDTIKIGEYGKKEIAVRSNTLASKPCVPMEQKRVVNADPSDDVVISEGFRVIMHVSVPKIPSWE